MVGVIPFSELWRRMLARRAGSEARETDRTRETGALELRLRKTFAPRRGSRFELSIDLSLSPGVTVLLGHSGAGKTTLLRCIAGLADPEEGYIAIGDKVLLDTGQGISVPPARRGVALVFQDLALFPHLSVEKNVAYGLRRLARKERAGRTALILESFHIAHLAMRIPREISGGEQQRVALARALVTDPAVLVLDEPLSSLDVRTKAGIIDDLRTWNESRRLPILHVTHDHAETLALGDRVIALERGRIVKDGLPCEVLPAPQREVIARSAGFANLIDATVVALHEREGTMTCRLSGTSLEIVLPLTRVPVGAHVRVGIHASDVQLVQCNRAVG